MADNQAGWYPDPAGDISKLRYWNGAQWTNDYTDVPGVAAPAQPFAQPVPPAQPQVSQATYYDNYGNSGQTYYAQAGAAPMDSSKQTMRLIAFVFNILATVALGWLIIPLAWMIPLTVMSWGTYKGTRKNTVALGVCTLIFMGLVSGILLLVSGEDQ